MGRTDLTSFTESLKTRSYSMTRMSPRLRRERPEQIEVADGSDDAPDRARDKVSENQSEEKRQGISIGLDPAVAQ